MSAPPNHSVRLGIKLSAAVAIALALVAAPSIRLNQARQREALRQQIHELGTTLASQTAAASLEPLLGGDYPVLQTVINAMARDCPDLTAAIVRRVDGTTVASFGDSGGVRSGVAFTAPIEISMSANKTETVGAVEIFLSPARANQMVSEWARGQLIQWVTTLLLLAVLLAAFTQLVIIRPIRRLHDQTRRLESGDFETPVQCKGNDEIAQLARATEGLRLSLSRSYSDLRERNEQLSTTSLQLRAALSKANSAIQAKNAFMGMISHEIRTPMNAVLGLCSNLLAEELPESTRDTVKTIQTSGEMLLDILSDVLDYSKLDAGTLTLSPHPFDLRDLVHQTIALVRGGATQKGLSIGCSIDSRLPLRVVADGTRLRQVLMNLLGNAVKFTEEGEVHLHLIEEGRNGDSLVLRVEIEDSGIGVNPTDIVRILEPFTQADSSTTRRFGGTGLGLSVTQRILEQMSSRVQVRSTPDLGSIFFFTITLPIATGAAAESPKTAGGTGSQHPPPELLVALRNARILLAEDNPVNVKVITSLLKRLEVRPVVAQNGQAAVDQYRNGSFDLILMDCMMPELDGYDATREIRAIEQKRSRHSIIVAVTANAMPEDRERCLEAGMDDYLAKPVRLPDLVGLLSRWVPQLNQVSAQ